MKTLNKVLLLCLSLLLLCSALSSCGQKLTAGEEVPPAATAPQSTTSATETEDPIDPAALTKNVLVTMENGETFTIQTAPQYAPQTVANFLALAESGFYDGLTFHRIIEGFMAQGGDPKGNGTGGSDKTIDGEFAANGFDQNTLSHTRGVVSMARSQAMDSASSQFFICYDNATYLDGQYAAFGTVIDGMETVDNFLKTPRDNADKPTSPIVIRSMEILP